MVFCGLFGLTVMLDLGMFMFVYYCLVLVISIGLFGRLDLSNCGAVVGLVFSWLVGFGLLGFFGLFKFAEAV